MGDAEQTPGADGQGGASFDFDANGLRTDSENNPVPTAGDPLKVAFRVCNVGAGPGSVHVTITVDGADNGLGWDSPPLPPGECGVPEGDGYVHGIPAVPEGSHTFVASVDAPGPGGGQASNTIDVAPAG